MLAGLCHDVDHRATTNIFEVNSASKLAYRYSDISVLENHHIATTFKIMSYENANILKNLNFMEY